MYYFIGRAICRLFLRIYGGWITIGAENIPATGGVILAPNHISYADPPAVGSAISRQVHFMAKEELFKGLLGKAIRKVGSFPVKRGTADRRAIKQALNILETGRVLCLFPEGTRSTDGNLQKAEVGLGMIALKSGAPVVPVAVIGTDKVMPSGGQRPKRCKMKLVFGKPLYFNDLSDANDARQSMEEVGNRVMREIGNLLSEHS